MKNLVIVLLAFTLNFGASIIKDFTFSKNELSIKKVDGYDLLAMKDFTFPTEPGKPLIPFYSISVLIPPTAEIKEVTILDYEKIALPGEYLIYPTQRPRPISQKTPVLFEPPDENIYSLNTEYPEKLYQVIRSGCKSGYRIAGIFLYPISYIPKERKLFLYKRLKLKIEYEEGVYQLQPLTPSQKSLFSQDVKSLVINQQDINRFSPPIFQTDDPGIDYIIITSNSLKGNFVPLVNWLRKTGFWADTISTTRINNNYTGRDLQEKIRNFIKDYFNTQGLKYVLLAGDQSIIPSRQARAWVSSYTGNIPCDLYYFDCLQYSWDGNQNNIFGDTFTISGKTDTVDLYYDVYGARWSVESTAEIDTMIRKLMTYTKNPDTLYQKRLLLPAALLWSGYTHRQSQDSIANLSPSGWTDRIIDQGTNDALRYQVRDSLNIGFGFCHLVAHGNDVATWINNQPQYHRNDPPNQTNYNKLTIANSIACYPGNFEYSDCLAEEMMKASGSAVGVMMNSRYGWGQPPWIGPSERLDINFFNYFFTHDSIRIASCHQSSKEYYRNTAMSQQVWRWCYYELNLFGEPSMMMWQDYPKKMVASFSNPIYTGNQSFTVTVTSQSSPVYQAIVALWKGNEVYDKGLTNSSGQASFTINPQTAGYIYVTVTAKNKIPYEDSCQVNLVIVDVGVTQISVATGTIDSGTVVSPQARVKNFGTFSATFPITFKIGTFYTSTPRTKTLNSGVEDTVNFSTWTAVQRGNWTTRCSTALTGDQNTANDTLSDSVTVRVRDICVTAIEVPIGTIDSGTVITPRARVRNNGTDIETFPVSFRIGSFYNSSSRTKTLNPGVEDTVDFSTWTALQRGNWTTKCSTALTGDQISGNNSLTGSVLVRVIDVTCLNILSPTGTIDSGTVITPVAQLRNNGTISATFSVTFRIGSFYNNTRSKTLSSGVTDTVGFINWTAIQVGTHMTKCTTALAGDMVLANDAFTGSVTIQVGVIPDVGVTQIIAPTSTIDTGTTITPQAIVKNFGNTQQSFPVSFHIGSFYNNTQNVNNLNPGDSTVVSFTDWIASSRGSYTTKCTTALTGDINSANNALSGLVLVRVQDVGITQIIAPAGMIDSGTVITPQAKAKNFGNSTATFPVTFSIGTSYTNTQNVTSLNPGDSTIISFTNWTAVQRDTQATKCSTALAVDQNTANDALNGLVVILVNDVGVAQIIAPVGNITIGSIVIPSARISNYGVNNITFPVYFRIIAGTDSVYSDDTIITIQANQDSIIDFTSWTAVSGSYRSLVRTVLAGDQISSNDTASNNFSVSELGWQLMANVPSSPSSKTLKNGSCLTGLNGQVFLLKANKTPDFYSYTPNSGRGVWTTLDPMPLGTKETGDGKDPKKGAAITGFNNKVYILRGNKTSGFWCYDTDPTIGWQKLQNILAGTKYPRDGSGLTYVRKDTFDCIFAMKGSKTNEFYLYYIDSNNWQQVASPTTGSSGKNGYKKGSCLTYDGDSLVYVLKGNYGDLFQYNVLNNTWTELKRYDRSIYLNRDGRRKKVKDGAGLAFINGSVYMLKGGNTNEFWKYDISTNDWSQMNPADIWDIPTGFGKRVKSGGALCVLDNYFYVTKGNKTPEFYKHASPASASIMMQTVTNATMSNEITNTNPTLSIIPNPAKHIITINYNLPKSELVSLKLYDITGTLVKSYYNTNQTKNGSIQIDVQTLSQGVYILRFNSEEYSSTRKLIIEK